MQDKQTLMSKIAQAVRVSRNPRLYSESDRKTAVTVLNAGMPNVPYSSILAQDRRKLAEKIESYIVLN